MRIRNLLLIVPFLLIAFVVRSYAEDSLATAQKESLACGCLVRLETPTTVYFTFIGRNQGRTPTLVIKSVSGAGKEDEDEKSPAEKIKLARDIYQTVERRLVLFGRHPYNVREAEILFSKYLSLVRENGSESDISNAAGSAGRIGNLFRLDMEDILKERNYPDDATMNFYITYINSGFQTRFHIEEQHRPSAADMLYGLDRLIQYFPSEGSTRGLPDEVAEFFAKKRPAAFKKFWNRNSIGIEIN